MHPWLQERRGGVGGGGRHLRPLVTGGSLKGRWKLLRCLFPVPKVGQRGHEAGVVSTGSWSHMNLGGGWWWWWLPGKGPVKRESGEGKVVVLMRLRL